jgi:hypothetical protein
LVKAVLILADAASGHPDHTFSLLRGGITEMSVPRNQPVVFRGALVARVTGIRAEAGKHDFRIVCVDEDGKQVAPPLQGNLEVPPQGGNAHIVLNMQLTFPRPGRYQFSIVVDRSELDVWEFEAKEGPPVSAGKKEA